MRKTLIIDTSTDKGLVALAEGSHVLSYQPISEGKASEEAAKLIQNNREKYLADLKAIAVTVGPGSFTGVRVGVALAKGLSYSLSIPLIGICSLEGFIANDVIFFASLIDARSAGAYVLLQKREKNKIIYLDHPALIQKKDLDGYLLNCECVVVPSLARLQIKNGLEGVPNPQRLAEIAEEKFEKNEYGRDVKLIYCISNLP